MREVRIALYETFASLDTRHSYRSIPEVRITPCEADVLHGAAKYAETAAAKAKLIRLPIPVVFGIAAFHLFADFVPCVVPKMFYVVGDLQRAAGR